MNHALLIHVKNDFTRGVVICPHCHRRMSCVSTWKTVNRKFDQAGTLYDATFTRRRYRCPKCTQSVTSIELVFEDYLEELANYEQRVKNAERDRQEIRRKYAGYLSGKLKTALHELQHRLEAFDHDLI